MKIIFLCLEWVCASSPPVSGLEVFPDLPELPHPEETESLDGNTSVESGQFFASGDETVIPVVPEGCEVDSSANTGLVREDNRSLQAILDAAWEEGGNSGVSGGLVPGNMVSHLVNSNFGGFGGAAKLAGSVDEEEEINRSDELNRQEDLVGWPVASGWGPEYGFSRYNQPGVGEVSSMVILTRRPGSEIQGE